MNYSLSLESLPHSISFRIFDQLDLRDLYVVAQSSVSLHSMCWLWWAEHAWKDFTFPQSFFMDQEIFLEEEAFPTIPIDMTLTNPHYQYRRVQHWHQNPDFALVHLCRKRQPPNHQLLQYFIAHGATSFNEALHRAAYRGYLETAKLILQLGATNVNMPMNSAAIKGHLDIIKLLIKHGATPQPHTLACAACGGHLDIIDYLSQFPPNQELLELNEALRQAALSGHLEAVQDLLRRGANNLHQALESALVNIRFCGGRSVVEFLRDSLSELNSSDPQVPALIRQALERESQWRGLQLQRTIQIHVYLLVHDALTQATQRTQKQLRQLHQAITSIHWPRDTGKLTQSKVLKS